MQRTKAFTLGLAGIITLAVFNASMHKDDVQPQEPITHQTEVVTSEDTYASSADAYKQAQIDHSHQLGQILDGMYSLNSELSSNPAVITDSYFVSRVEDKGEQMASLVRQLDDLPQPSDAFAESDKLYRQAVEAYAEGVTYYVQGVQQDDIDLMLLSADKTQIGNALLNEAVQSIEGVE